MRVLVVLGVVAGCTKASPNEPPHAPPADAVVDHLIGPRPVVVDAIPIDADLADKPIDVPALAMAGPYPSLEASCNAARPCGELTIDDQGKATSLPTTPDCTAVLDPSQDHTTVVPRSFAGRITELVHAVPGGEVRLGGVQCAIPKGSRGDRSEHYVFVKRGDGWWRTQAPVYEHSYNEKYCIAASYVMWNVSAARTIVGLAAGRDCLSCNKQMMTEALDELMVRIEPGGARPRVFAPLPVGVRDHTINQSGSAVSSSSDPDCKVGAHATSVKETWLADTEVVLSGPATADGDPLATTFTLGSADVTKLARPGHYRFPRP